VLADTLNCYQYLRIEKNPGTDRIFHSPQQIGLLTLEWIESALVCDRGFPASCHAKVNGVMSSVEQLPAFAWRSHGFCCSGLIHSFISKERPAQYAGECG
jgi:hypothetical protein